MKKNAKPTILIIGGTGSMGQWFKNFFEQQGLHVITLGRLSRNSIKQKISIADIVMIAVPISQTISVIESVLPHLRADQLVCDITSLKTLPVQAMQKAPGGILGMHPLFGPTIVNPSRQKIVTCLVRTNHHTKLLLDLFTSAEIELIPMKPEVHDEQMARIQALTHAINLLYARTISKEEKQLDQRLSTPLFTLQQLVTARVLSLNAKLITDIELTNPYFLPMLKQLEQETASLITNNEQQDGEAIQKTVASLQKDFRDLSPYSIRATNRILDMLQEKPLTTTGKLRKVANSHIISVGYFGPEGTNTHQAAMQLFPKATLVPFATIAHAFAAVQQKSVEIAVVPSENSLQGTVRETYDLLADSPVRLVGSFEMPIHHALLSLETNSAEITSVVSHPQALAQCSTWLDDHLPQAARIVAMSTTSNLSHPAKATAYIASELAAKHYQIPILATGIENSIKNTTRFYVIARDNLVVPALKRNSTLLFLTIYNRVGILRDILDILASVGINLSKLESRPSNEKQWDYCFYIEIDKAPDAESVQQALKKLKQLCTSVRVLGLT